MAGLGDLVGGLNINFSGILGTILTIAAVVAIAITVGGIVFLIFRWRSNKKNANTLSEIHWHEEINSRLVPVRIDYAEEVSIPGTSLKLFYIKDRDTWLFRFTRAVRPGVFYVAITKNKEIVNFELTTIEENMKKAGIEFDHTDMRWAAENMREFVKRNYKDKGVTWWREYKDIITLAIYILVLTISFAVIAWAMWHLLGKIGDLLSIANDTLKQANVCRPINSGVILAK